MEEQHLTFFMEGDEVIGMLKTLHAAKDPADVTRHTTPILEKYMEAPHLLDGSLELMITPLVVAARKQDNAEALDRAVFEILYVLTKVRGYKTVLKFFSHEAADFHPAVNRLVSMDPKNHVEWHKRYILLLWLSLICMLPFDMAVLDSGGKESDVRKIMKICYLYLEHTDKCREAAAVLTARLTTRPDLHSTLMKEFLAWSKDRLTTADIGNVGGMITLTGVLSALSYIFKFGKRNELLPYASELSEHLEECDLTQCSNTLIRKLSTKLSQRLGLTFLQPRLAPWRYQRGKRTLLGIGESSATQEGNKTAKNEEEDMEYDIPDDVEGVIDHMLTALRDSDTIVRWSAAKGMGRITGRLPLELADEVVGSVLELCSTREGHAAWHGACLALAELGRRGLLLPDRLTEVVPVVLKALAFDEQRGSSSIGAHVRDAACYVSWAFARAYDPLVIKQHIEEIAKALVVTTVFDREINVRRAASAAFQENVGRQGTLPNGIAIVTEADYFAVGNRNKSYLDISVYIAQYEEYTIPLVNHLVDVKLAHWDKAVRELAAKSLNRLYGRCPEYILKCLTDKIFVRGMSVDLNTRHGNILAIGEVLNAIESNEMNETVENGIERVCSLITNLSEQAAFRGSGGEMIRAAVLTMIEKSVQPGLNIPNECVGILQGQVDENLCYDKDEVQTAAISAFQQISISFYSGLSVEEIAHQVIGQLVAGLQAPGSPARARCGYAAALGRLSKQCILKHLNTIVPTIINASALPAVVDELATDARCMALKSLASILVVALENESEGAVAIKQIEEAVDAFVCGTEDYTIDSRGDIGSKVREESMRSLQYVLVAMAKLNSETIRALVAPTCRKFMGRLVQQIMEKIDRTRSVAGKMLDSLCVDDSLSMYIPDKDLLRSFGFGSGEIDWHAASDTFHRTVKLLGLPFYRNSALTGLVVSVGGLTESLVKHSSSSLLDYLGLLTDDESLEEFCNEILTIFGSNQHNSRITIPVLKTLDLLLCHGAIESVIGSGDFGQRLLDFCKAELKGSSDVKKIYCGVDVICGLLVAPDPVRKSCLNSLMIHLCHKYPRVRKFTAEKLYVSLMAIDEAFSEEVSEEVSNILTETLWDDDVKNARLERNKICDLLELPKPKLKAKKQAEPTSKSQDELDSYRDLVERTGF